jgi:hypothetical protein
MKRQIVVFSLALIMGWAAQGGIIYSSFADSGNIPDGNASGSAGTATASGFLPTISDISVKLNISGGYNGDLYAYLSYGGVLVPLLILVRVQVETNNPGPCTDAPHPVLVRSQPWQARFQGSYHPGHV